MCDSGRERQVYFDNMLEKKPLWPKYSCEHVKLVRLELSQNGKKGHDKYYCGTPRLISIGKDVFGFLHQRVYRSREFVQKKSLCEFMNPSFLPVLESDQVGWRRGGWAGGVVVRVVRRWMKVGG